MMSKRASGVHGKEDLKDPVDATGYRCRETAWRCAGYWAGIVLAALVGCKLPLNESEILLNPPPQAVLPAETDGPLREGDVLDASFFRNYEYKGAYQLDVDDSIVIEIEGRPTLSTEAIILPDGTINAPLLGPVPARGETVKAISDRLTTLYNESHLEKAVVSVRVLQANGRLRGFLQRLGPGVGGASLEVEVQDGRLELPLIAPIEATGRAFAAVQEEIQEHYRENLPGLGLRLRLKTRKPQFVAVVGEVNRSGVFELNRPLTVVHALALAGGTTDQAWLKQTLLMHPQSDGTLSVRVLDLKKAFRGGSGTGWGDYLASDDVVYVPRSPIADLDIWVDQHIYKIVPISTVNTFILYELFKD